MKYHKRKRLKQPLLGCHAPSALQMVALATHAQLNCRAAILAAAFKAGFYTRLTDES